MKWHRDIMFVILGVICIAWFPGCDIPIIETLDPESSLGSGFSIDERQHRDLRIVFLFYDQNELQPLVDQQIADILRVEEHGDRVHVVIARASSVVPHSISYVQDQSLRYLKIKELPRQPLEEPETLALLMREIDTEFPAARQLLIISGHGRGWRGIGSFDANRQRVLNGDTLAQALENVPQEVAQILVLEAGWSGFADFIYPFQGFSLDIIAAPFNIVHGGMNHRRWLNLSQRSEWQDIALRDYVHQEMVNAAIGSPVTGEPIHLTEQNLRDLGLRIGSVFNRAQESINDLNREALRKNLLSQSIQPPGSAEAHITIETLCTVLAELSCTELIPEEQKIALHLAVLDSHGAPTSITPGYFSPEIRKDYAFIRALDWAPDGTSERGFLGRLWFAP
jgi:hypothetical protein